MRGTSKVLTHRAARRAAGTKSQNAFRRARPLIVPSKSAPHKVQVKQVRKSSKAHLVLEAYLAIIPNGRADASRQTLFMRWVSTRRLPAPCYACRTQRPRQRQQRANVMCRPWSVLLLLVQIRDQSTPDFTSPFVRRPFHCHLKLARNAIRKVFRIIRQDGRR